MAEYLIPYIRFIPRILQKNKFSSIDKVSKISAPILFISGLSDLLVPPSMMSILYNNCGSARKQLLQLQNGEHMNTWAVAGYYQGISQFLAECKELKGPQQTPPTRVNLWPIIEEV